MARLVFHLDDALLARSGLTADALAHAQACEQHAADLLAASEALCAERVREPVRGLMPNAVTTRASAGAPGAAARSCATRHAHSAPSA
jgi:hypothetical protein